MGRFGFRPAHALAFAVLPIGLLLASGSPAIADCTSTVGTAATPGPNAIVTCTVAGGTETTPIAPLVGSTNVQVTVDLGASVSTASTAIALQSNSSVVNNGTVSSTLNNTATINHLPGTSGTTTTNNGSITTAGASTVGINFSGSNHTVTNAGTITTNNNTTAGIQGVATGAGNSITNSGTITLNGTGGAGILANGAITVLNTGNINVAAGTSGIQLGGAGGATATNNGTILAGGVGISVSGANNQITNNGTITSTATHGTQIGGTTGTTFTNNGTITTTALNTAGILGFATSLTAINNAGATITSPFPVFLSAGLMRFENFGTVTATAGGGSAIQTNDVLLGATSVVNGAITGPTGTDLLTLRGANTEDSAIDTFETIATEAGAVWTLSGVVTSPAGGSTFNTGAGSQLTLSGTLAGGALTKTGTGTLILSGTNTYTGATTVNAGVLNVLSSIAGSAVTVNGGTLMGTGSLGATNIAAGSVHAPGASIGTQTVNGNYVLAGTLQVEVNPVAADLVVVTGDVNITGATLNVMELTASGWQPTQSYTIIDNQGPNAVTGTFGTVTNVYAFLTPSVVYAGGDGNNVVLTLVRNAIAFSSAGLTPNQIAAGGGAQSAGAASPLSGALVVLAAPVVPAAFDQIAGELHASLKGVLVDDSRFVREGMLARTFALLNGGVGTGSWLHAYGLNVQRAGDGNASALSASGGGLMAGGDGATDQGLVVGLAAGIGRSLVAIPTLNSTGTSDNAQIGAYGALPVANLLLSFGGAYTRHAIATTRMPTFPGFAETITTRYDAGTLQGFAEAAYRIEAGDSAFMPFAGLAGVFQHSNGYAETGGASALTAAASQHSAAVASIGVRASHHLVLDDGVAVDAHGSLAWRQMFGGTATATHTFAGGTPFTVAAVPPSGALAIEAGSAIALGETVKVDLLYQGQFAAGLVAHSAKGTLSVAF